MRHNDIQGSPGVLANTLWNKTGIMICLGWIMNVLTSGCVQFLLLRIVRAHKNLVIMINEKTSAN
ncbi:hypothetical protein D088_850003 [Salmonella enterica subsp. houtenae serovar 16:z4,z32:-- str. RKS3027]|nr:hypothetical protein D088_850003 [Salmonella enterica subsp. houtenae serovar 16:z4,z32:-- str. RKS3027]